MSLINDALKRAKQAQQQTPPAGAVVPPLPPAEPAPVPPRRAVLFIALITSRHWLALDRVARLSTSHSRSESSAGARRGPSYRRAAGNDCSNFSSRRNPATNLAGGKSFGPCKIIAGIFGLNRTKRSCSDTVHASAGLPFPRSSPWRFLSTAGKIRSSKIGTVETARHCFQSQKSSRNDCWQDAVRGRQDGRVASLGHNPG